jgi:hypothetical protein
MVCLKINVMRHSLIKPKQMGTLNPNKWAHKPKQMGTLKLSTILRELIETLQCFESRWLGYIVGKCKICIPQLETQSFHPFRIQLWMWSGTTVFTDQHHDNYFRNENLTKWKYHWNLQNAFTQFPILHYKKKNLWTLV